MSTTSFITRRSTRGTSGPIANCGPVPYGRGEADLLEGLSAAIMSEIMHNNGIATERTLAIIAYPDGTSVNVRAAQSLLRPAHFFAWLKQGNLPALKAAVDFYIERRAAHGGRPGL